VINEIRCIRYGVSAASSFRFRTLLEERMTNRIQRQSSDEKAVTGYLSFMFIQSVCTYM